MATFVAVPFQAYELTGSSLAVGLLGVAEFAPILVLALVGGALADAFDRRRLVQIAEVGAAIAAGALLVNAALPDPQLWVLYVCAALMAAFTAVRRPPLDALIPRLVERDELKAASALQFSFHNMAALAGPALAGVLIAAAGPDRHLRRRRRQLRGLAGRAQRDAHAPAAARRRAAVAAHHHRGPALRRARARTSIGTYLVDMNAMFFGMPMALFPAIAKGYGGPEVLGLLYAAPSAGSIAVTLTSGWTARVHRHGRAIVYGAGAWGLGIIAFGFADALWVAVGCLVVAGAMDTISGIFRSAIWNETIPDHLRGRLAGVEMISWSSGPLLRRRRGRPARRAGRRPRVRDHRRHRVRGRHGRARRRATALLGLRQPRARGR